MDTEKLWMGLDLGLTRTHLCVIDGDGETLHEQDCESNAAALTAAMSAFPFDQIGSVAVEAGTGTHMVRKLRKAGFPVDVFEARKASKFLAVRSNKTDLGDARGLADLARLGQKTVSQVYVKSPECERLRSKLVMRKRIVLQRVAAEGVLRSRLASYGLKYKPRNVEGGIREHLATHLDYLRIHEGADLSGDLMPLAEVCEIFRTHLRKLDRDLAKLAESHEICRLLMEVPGVGPICAISFYTAIDDPTRFEHASDVAAYLGLVPKRYQSGEVSRTLGITKTGSKLTRTHLVTAAMIFGIHAPDCALKQWYAQLRERIGGNRARVALARKLAILLLTMWKNGTHFEARAGSA